MKKESFFLRLFAAMLFILTVSGGCKPLIAGYDQYAYAQATSLKVDALALMDKASDDYNRHTQEVADMNIKMQKAYEYEKNRPQNSITADMWNLMMNDKSLYGGFIVLWKEQKTVGQFTIDEAKKKVAENFDRISQLESKKITK
jgi:hypothetical protein